jgi:uncharacterized membrane protein (DUF106 family)
MAAPSDEPEVQMGQMLTPLLMLVGMSFLIFIPSIRTTLSVVAGTVIEPLVPFHDVLFIPTVLVLGTMIMFVNTIIRSFFMDPVKQAHFQHRNKQLRSMMNDARMERNTSRLDKISKIQQRMMPEQMKMQMSMMRPMMFTMIFIFGIFGWMYTSVENFRVEHLSLPWKPQWHMEDRVLWIFPAWVFVYISLSAPFGRVLDRHIRLIRYKTHPLIVSGEKIPEPLLEMLKDSSKETRGSSRTKRSQRGGRKSSSFSKSKKNTGNQIISSSVIDGTCPVCSSMDLSRGKAGHLRCGVCWESFRP